MKTLVRQWQLIIVLALCGLLGGLGYSLFAPKEYKSSAQVLITAEAYSAGDRLQAATYIDQIAPTYASTAVSSAVLTPVLGQLGSGMTLEEVRQSLDITTASDAPLITITASAETADGAHRLAEALTQQFVTVASDLISPVVSLPGTPSPSQPQSLNVLPVNLVLVVVDPPSIPPTADSPQLALGLAVGLAAGLVVGVAVALLMSRFDQRIRSVEEVAETARLPVLAVVPPTAQPEGTASWDWHDKEPDPGRSVGLHRAPVAAESTYPPIATEAILELRSAVFSWERNGETLLFAGVGQRAGTTTLVTDLAFALSRAGARTVLVDADLSVPGLHAALDIPRSPGLAEVLGGQATPEDAEQEVHGLSVITAGTAAENDFLMASARLPQALTAFARDRRTVLIDGPSVSTSTAALTLAPLVTACILVVRIDQVTFKQLTTAVDKLNTSGTPLRGVVVTLGHRRLAGLGGAAARRVR